MIDVTCQRQNKFGFYQVGNYKTYSKFRAVEHYNKSNEKIKWNFNDEVYQCYNWSVEPKETLSELYRQRAQELRDQYDYLVLWFSGGADSTNILNSFIDNDIKLDEVASYVNYEANGNTLDFFNAEIFHVTPEVVAKARIQQPDLRHTVVDLAKLTMQYFTDKSVKYDWSYYVNSIVNPNTVSRRDIKLQILHWTKLFDSGKKVGFISGICKPRVVGINENYYHKFVDMIDGAVTPECQMLDRPWDHNELFYWSADHPKISIKQGHIVKNYLKTLTKSSPEVTDKKELASTVTVTIDKKICYLTLPALHTLIYPKWTPVAYQFKPVSLTFSFRDAWFFNLSNSDSVKYAWQTGLEHRWNSTPDILKNNYTNLGAGFKSISSTIYNLGS